MSWIHNLMIAAALAIFGFSCRNHTAQQHSQQPPPTVGDPSVGEWRDEFASPGVNGGGAQVHTMARDAQGRVYMGGRFMDAAGVPALNVARWDGNTWQALGSGLPGPVFALTFSSGGELYAGGAFSPSTPGMPAGNQLARWDGASWALLPGRLDGDINALAVQGDRILVGGAFTSIDGVPMGGLAAFNGSTWVGLGATNGVVQTLVVTGDSGFCVGGNFSLIDGVPASNVANWDGTRWSQLGDGLNGSVSRLVRSPEGRICAGGKFGFWVDYDLGLTKPSLAILEGATWMSLHGGVNNGWVNDVRAIAFMPNGDLIVGGAFGKAGFDSPVLASNIARYSLGTQQWSTVNGGLRKVGSAFSPMIEGVYDILVQGDGTLVIGGFFSNSADGAVQVSNVARLDASGWSALVQKGSRYWSLAGSSNAVAMEANGSLVVGGYFNSAGGVPTSNIARLGPHGWEALGQGLSDSVLTVLPRSNGEILAGGKMLRSGQSQVGYLARFSGTGWTAFGSPDGPVRVLLDDGMGGFYAGGDFGTCGGIPCNGVAHWDGTHWAALGNGFDSSVFCLALDSRGRLVAGGTFNRSGTTFVNKLAVWNGQSWESIGSGFINTWGYPRNICAVGNDLIIAGSFDKIGGQSIQGIARWDGSRFSPVSTGLNPENKGGLPFVTALQPYGRGFFLTGSFQLPGHSLLRNLAWFDGTKFHPIGSGLDDLGENFCVSGTTLWVGGPFQMAGGRSAGGISAWDFKP